MDITTTTINKIKWHDLSLMRNENKLDTSSYTGEAGSILRWPRRVTVQYCQGFDLFIHWLIKQITNAYWNYFSKSYENRSNCVHIHSAVGSMIKEGCRWRIRKPSSLSVLKVVEASFILQVTSKSLEKHDSLKICILRFYMFHQAL